MAEGPPGMEKGRSDPLRFFRKSGLESNPSPFPRPCLAGGVTGRGPQALPPVPPRHGLPGPDRPTRPLCPAAHPSGANGSQRAQTACLCYQKRLPPGALRTSQRLNSPVREGTELTYSIIHFPKSTVFFVDGQKPAAPGPGDGGPPGPTRFTPHPAPAAGSAPAHPSTVPGTRTPPSRGPAAPPLPTV